MPIRWKLLILLVVMTLPPLVFVAGAANRATGRLGETIGRQTRDALTRRAEHQLQDLVRTQARILGGQARIIEMLLRLQAAEVERCLAADDAPDARVLFPEDFRKGTDVPGGLTESPRYVFRGARGETAPMKFSLTEPVFVVAPGVDPASVAPDARRLSRIAPVYRQLYEQHADLLFWQYTALETGLHVAYPGHGEYPPDYDARQRQWYQRAQQRAAMTWIPPYVDAATGQAVLTAALPVRGPDGRCAGVTAIDMVVGEMIEQSRLPAFGSPAAYLVTPVPRATTVTTLPRELDRAAFRPEELALMIVVRPEASRTGRPAADAPDWLDSADRPAFLDMIRDMQAGRSGVREMEHEGQRCLWAYGAVWQNKSFSVVILPCERVVADAVRAQKTVLGLTAEQLRLEVGTMAAAALAVAATALVASRAVTRPILHLAAAADRIAAGDFEARVDVRTRDEIGELAAHFNEMVPALRDRMRLRESLSLAMEVQQHLLPAGAPRIEGLDIAGTSIYCDETGGDYYDFIDLSQISPDEVGIAVGDVTGHGIAAALLMTGARALLRSRTEQPGTLADVMHTINRHLTADAPAGRFMTLFYMVINARLRRLRWVNAGHDPAILYDPSAGTFEELGEGGLPLGIELDADYEEHQWEELKPGQVIVIGTDGIWEASDGDRVMFGKEGLREVIRREADRPAADIMRAVTDAVAAFRRDQPQQDDVTLVVVKVVA